LNSRRNTSLRPKNWDFSGPTPSNGPSNGFARIKILNQIKLDYKEKLPFRTLYGIFYFIFVISVRLIANGGIG
jgi:hypothetical protein